MKTSLIKGLDKDQTKDVRADFLSSHILRKRIVNILQEKIETSRASSRSLDSYNSPNWPYLQAGLIEREKAYLEVISLLED